MNSDVKSCDPADTFKILVATDIHLGYNEKDPITGNDSFEAFEEILQIAHKHKVDFVLLGGDLFDENKPTAFCWQKCVETLRKYTLGNEEIKFHVINSLEDCENPSEELDNAKINFYDQNINISMPIFSIHGNHDDPTGMRSVSSLDTLAAMGLVNYIGRTDNVDKLKVKPLLLCKGETQLVIYGLGHYADKRLARLFREKKVLFNIVDPDTTFQLLVLHQNRANRGTLNYLPYTCIPSTMDLVIWGHEHDCYIVPECQNDVYYCQPGSSVATSLSEGEAIPKHVGILYVNEKNFHLEPIRLRTVRPFIFKQVFAEPIPDLLGRGLCETEFQEEAEKHLIKEIESIMEEIRVDPERMNDKEPLVRVVYFLHDEAQRVNDRSLTLMLDGKIANPKEVVIQKLISKKKPDRHHRTRGLDDDDIEIEGDELPPLSEYMSKAFEKVCLSVLTPSGFVETLNRVIDCGDANAFNDYFSYREKIGEEKLLENYESSEDEEQLYDKINDGPAVDESSIVRNMLADPKRNSKAAAPDSPPTGVSAVPMIVSTEDSDPEPPAKRPATRGRGRGRGRAKRT